MKLSRDQRNELKKRLRRASQYEAYQGNLSVLRADELVDLAGQWGVAIPTEAEVSIENGKRTDPASAFDDEDTGEDTDTKTPGRSGSSVDPDETVRAVLAKMGAGDLMGFQSALRDLAIEAAKPPREVIKEIEKVVERIVEVEGAAAHLRPTHMPSATGKVKSPWGLEIEKWDAPDAPSVDKHYRWPSGAAVAVSKIARQQPVFLTGPAGTGKTTFAEQIAALQGRPFVRISCHEQTDGPTLVGMVVPDGKGGVHWQDGQLTKAIRRPGTLVLIDEPSTARPGAMMILQAVLEPQGKLHIETTGEVVRKAAGVSFILADNTGGFGDETGQYEATRRMNRATLDRMAAAIVVDYLPTTEEARVLVDRTGCSVTVAGMLAGFAKLTRDGAGKGQYTHGVGLRRLISWAEALVDKVDARAAFDACVLNMSAPDDREALRQLYAVHIGSKL